MYNELWPTGGWGSIEYGGDTAGQVSGGRWKPLQYFFRRSVFADQMATCTTTATCFVTNDAPFPFAGRVEVVLLNTLTGNTTLLGNHPIHLGAGAGITEWFCPTATTTHDPTPTAGAEVDPTVPESALPPPPPAPAALAAAAYAVYDDVVPINRFKFTKQGTASVCEAACTADAGCDGFTIPTAKVSEQTCYFYSDVPALAKSDAGNWYQKPTAPELFIKYTLQLPADRASYSQIDSGTPRQCSADCDAEQHCVGYTMLTSSTPEPPSGQCWLYHNVTALANCVDADWYQKQGTPPIPAPPPPPVPPPPPPAPPTPPAVPPLPCVPWQSIPALKELGCGSGGFANCIVTVEVFEDHEKDEKREGESTRTGTGTGTSISRNVLPFQPPKAMKLAAAVVSVAVGLPAGAAGVPLTLTATATALYVTLTTLASGRFSDNSFLLQTTSASAPTIVYFLPWGEFGAPELALLKASIRVEHLQENV